MSKQNTGELADDILSELTPIEELVRDLNNKRTIYECQIEDAVEQVERAQSNASEILRRYEERNGPI